MQRDGVWAMRARVWLRQSSAVCVFYFHLLVGLVVLMIADKHITEEVGTERTINGRKIPLGTWLLEKLGLCNCCPKARCAFVRERRRGGDSGGWETMIVAYI